MPRKIKPHAASAPLEGTGFTECFSGTYEGTDGRDTLAFRAGYGDSIIIGFDPAQDRLMFDYGAWSDIAFLGTLATHMEWDSLTAHFSTTYDGADTTISVGGDSITLVGVDPASVYGWAILGG